jgi:hypothetical protein
VRYPLALEWFGPEGGADGLYEAGLRAVPIDALRADFAQGVGQVLLGERPAPYFSTRPSVGRGWRRDTRRRGALPAGLYEVIRFKDPELAH